MHSFLRMLWGNSKTLKFHRLMIFYQPIQFDVGNYQIIQSRSWKFYPQFYKAFSSTENLYKNIIGNCSLLLSFEVANNVLAQLARATIQEDVLTYAIEEAENFSEKDLSLISYLGGYVFGTFYRRIRCSTKDTGL